MVLVDIDAMASQSNGVTTADWLAAMQGTTVSAFVEGMGEGSDVIVADEEGVTSGEFDRALRKASSPVSQREKA